MADNAVQSVGKGPGNQTRVIVIMGGLIIVALVGVIIALVLNLNSDRGGEQQTEAQSEHRAVVISEENAEEVLTEMEEAPQIPQGYFEMSMNMDWVFPDGESPSTNAYVANVASNEHPIYFDVSRRDTGEVIYRSPILPLGTQVSNFPLDVDLDAGVYTCVCTYHLVDDEQRTLSTLNMEISVTVEN